jgi:mono/diheme cytochrome c family protein
MNSIRFSQLFIVVSLAILFPGKTTVAHEWMAPKDASEIQNPIPADSASVTRGNELFINYCASCHGNKAQGLTAQEAGLKGNPPNLPKRLRTHTDGDFFWKIQEGRGEMPSFKDELENDEIWDIINFIKKK